MPEDAYGYWDSGPARGGGSGYLSTLTATNEQLRKLTDVLHNVGIIREDEKLLTISALLGREINNMRCIHHDEAEELLQQFGVV
ncbi:hypothetical protein [Arthrobacter oryzae]|uniref:hypothetical protein n=1 Tax=Arthrobacter oryzae TaxID=409290 RepID=UPI002786205C|nr:hypothetical protein [Arthrobacter oryzae]MDQ0076789.1 short subunit dehydrogenase-like uncharacterized protein [Arthrobacter oryzae]